MAQDEPDFARERFDLVLVGTGFASSFFLEEWLKHAAPLARAVVLERGAKRDHAWHLAHEKELERDSQAAVRNATPEKPWTFKLVFGGASNCWWACAPRFLPEDFRLHSTFGVGRDWPIGYDELEGFYCEVEERMQVSGSNANTPAPRSRPFPLPPHRFNDPDRLLEKRFPDQFFHLPCARPSRELAHRPRCCASGVCNLCPIDSKFTILNGLAEPYLDPRVRLVVGANVTALECTGSKVDGVRGRLGSREFVARGDLIALGANAIFNAHILLASGRKDPELGEGLVEQVSAAVDVALDGVDNFQGSTSNTGHGYMLYRGERRRDRAGALMESWNVPTLRDERGKWRKRAVLKFVFEDLRAPQNCVRPSADDPTKPEIVYRGPSDYAKRALERFASDVEPVLAALPVESLKITIPQHATEAHVLGTTVMGDDPQSSVIDRGLVHHSLRNLMVLGGGAFPTIAPANPTLTLSALSVYAARKALGSR